MVSGLILPFSLFFGRRRSTIAFIFLIFKGKEGSLWPNSLPLPLALLGLD